MDNTYETTRKQHNEEAIKTVSIHTPNRQSADIVKKQTSQHSPTHTTSHPPQTTTAPPSIFLHCTPRGPFITVG